VAAGEVAVAATITAFGTGKCEKGSTRACVGATASNYVKAAFAATTQAAPITAIAAAITATPGVTDTVTSAA